MKVLFTCPSVDVPSFLTQSDGSDRVERTLRVLFNPLEDVVNAFPRSWVQSSLSTLPPGSSIILALHLVFCLYR